jgi:hypothetical protein
MAVKSAVIFTNIEENYFYGCICPVLGQLILSLEKHDVTCQMNRLDVNINAKGRLIGF